MAFSYAITEQNGVYFITCVVVQWIDVFSRKTYADIIIDSLQFCTKNKALRIYGWVIMSNHIHLIISCDVPQKLSDVLRDFKKYTSKRIVNAIEQNIRESRQSWLLWLLRKKEEITFWQPGNHPEEVRTQSFFLQKLNYIHQNPVRAGLVRREEDYVYSSAHTYLNGNGVLPISLFEGFVI